MDSPRTEQEKFKYSYSNRNQMLNISDAYISVLCCEEANNVLEVGVYKGGWSLCMVENVKSINIFCVDPFPGIDNIRVEFLEAASLHKNLTHYESIDQLKHTIGEKMDVIHLDGEHTELAVSRDLEILLPMLSSDGVMIIDDIFYQDFPGVAFSTYNFIAKFKLAPFLVSSSKIYLTHPSTYDYWYRKIKTKLSVKQIRFYESQERTGIFTGYPQSNSINGFSVMIVKDKEFLTRITRKTLGTKAKIKEPNQWIKSVTPPLVYRVLKKLKELASRN